MSYAIVRNEKLTRAEIFDKYLKDNNVQEISGKVEIVIEDYKMLFINI